MRHILLTLADGEIKPKISKYVNSDELAYGLVTIENGNDSGSIICEPWNKRGPPNSLKGGYTRFVE